MKYNSAEEVLDAFMSVRSEFYRRRREHRLIELAAELRRASNKIRFITAVTADQLVVYKQPKATLLRVLQQQQFHTALQLLPRLPVYKDHTPAAPVKFLNDVPEAAAAADATLESDAFDYLLNMPLSSLTAERLAALQTEHDQAATQLAAMQAATPASLWLADLDKFESLWQDLERKRIRGVNSAGRAKTIEEEAEIEEEEETEEAELDA